MNFKKNSIILLGILSLILIYFFSLNVERQLDKEQKQENEEYPSIEKTQKDYKGHVVKFSRSEIFRGRTFNIELSNGDKFAISGKNENAIYKKRNLEDNLRIGDSIYYNYETYEFFIFQDQKVFRFKLFN